MSLFTFREELNALLSVHVEGSYLPVLLYRSLGENQRKLLAEKGLVAENPRLLLVPLDAATLIENTYGLCFVTEVEEIVIHIPVVKQVKTKNYIEIRRTGKQGQELKPLRFGRIQPVSSAPTVEALIALRE